MIAPPRSRSTASGRRWALPALLLLLPFLVWPLGAMLWRAVAPEGALSVEATRAVIGSRFAWERLGFTAAQAAASTVIALVAGLPAAYVFSQLRFPARDAIRTLLTFPLLLPPIVVALAFRTVLAEGGWLDGALGAIGVGPVRALGTLWAIVAAHVFSGVAITLYLVASAWRGLDPREEEAARTLGAGRLGTFGRVTLRALLPAIGAAAALTFVLAFTSFAVVFVLGAPRYDTLEAAIYRLATQPARSSEASMLAALQAVSMSVVLVLTSMLRRRSICPPRRRVEHARSLRQASWGERVLLLAVLIVLALLVVAPLAAVVYGAVTRDGALTGSHFAALLRNRAEGAETLPRDAARWSAAFAAGSAVLALLAGGTAAIATARARARLATLVEVLLMLPVALPGVALGFAYLRTFDRGWYDLGGSPWLVLLAHTLIAYPLVLLGVRAVMRAHDPRLLEAAAMLGATPSRAWRLIVLPLVGRAIAAGAAIGVVVSLGELGATLLLRRPAFSTIPVAIFEAAGRPDAEALGRALALSTVLMAATVIAFAVIGRARGRDTGGW